MSQFYIALSIISLGAVTLLVLFSQRGKKSKHSPKLAQLSLLLVISGIFLGDVRIIGYPLIASGITIALIDIKRKLES